MKESTGERTEYWFGKRDTYNESPELTPRTLRRRFVVRICLDLGNIGDKVHLERLDERRSRPQLRTDVQDGEEDEGKVVGDEGRLVPIALQEDGPAAELRVGQGESTTATNKANVRGGTYHADEEAHDHSVPRRIRLQACPVRELPAVEALRLHARIEARVRQSDAEPGHQASDGGH